jgi:hypothetical protein
VGGARSRRSATNGIELSIILRPRRLRHRQHAQGTRRGSVGTLCTTDADGSRLLAPPTTARVSPAAPHPPGFLAQLPYRNAGRPAVSEA